MKYTDRDGGTYSVRRMGDKVIVTATNNPATGKRPVLTIEDNGNGFYTRAHSFTCACPDRIHNIDYDEAEYIYFAMKFLRKKGL